MFGVRMCSLPSDRIVSQRCWSVQIQRMFGLSLCAADELAASPAPAAPTNLRRVIDASTAGRLSHAATNARAHSASRRLRVAVTSLQGAVLVRADGRFLSAGAPGCPSSERRRVAVWFLGQCRETVQFGWVLPDTWTAGQAGRGFLAIQCGSVPGSSRARPLREGGVYPRVKATNSSPDFLPPLPMSRPPPPAAMTTYCLPSTT